MDPNETPRVFSERYELNHLIARGGMAEVYRAHDRLLDRPVALKVLFPELSVDRSFVERFRREAQAAANLSHPNIVPVFDWGEDTGTYFIVMEFIDGRPLSSILKSAGPLSAERTADIGSHVAAALGYAHKHGVIHRDVKPGNVLITDDGQVKVTDFGIARAVNTEESLTQTGAVMGTATYFSPEQAEGLGVDSRSDIYSLGVVLFEMVTGRPPFLGESPVAVASKHVRDNPPAPRELNPQIPPTFEAIILKSMAKDPAHRYATAEELRADLLRFNEGRSVLAMEDTTSVIGVAGATTTMTAVGGMDATRTVSSVGGGASDGLPGADGGAPDESDSNRTRNYAIALVVLLLLLAAAAFFLGRNLGYFGGQASFNVPDVVGQQAAVATATLRADGLNVTQVQQVSNDTPGTVISSNPDAKSLVKKGDTVTIKVAQLPPPVQVTVPEGLVNTTQANATAILQSAGLTTTVTTKVSSAQKGTVLSTNPTSGTRINQGSAVVLTVSSGPANAIVPSLIGLSQPVAGQTLASAGLVVGNVTSVPSQDPAGNVVSSNPGTGASVPPGTPVDIAVSSGPPPTTTTTSTPTTTTTTTPTTTTAPAKGGGGPGGGGGGNQG
jgi:beta-lactam-binding protein with PASTA domain/tRNA A-37 threonylcarbamoyl transferase component Bud32